MSKKNKTKKSTVIGAGIGILLVVFVFTVMPYLQGDNAGFDKTLVGIANEMNKSCPMTIDAETQMDNVIALPGNTLQYNYTLINYETADVDADVLKANIEPSVINNVKTNPDMKLFRDNNATLAYNYMDKNGAFILKFSVTPEMYLD